MATNKFGQTIKNVRNYFLYYKNESREQKLEFAQKLRDAGVKDEEVISELVEFMEMHVTFRQDMADAYSAFLNHPDFDYEVEAELDNL